jgi:hypothetical protein
MQDFGKLCIVALVLTGVVIMETALAMETLITTVISIPEKIKDGMSFHPYF